MQKPNEPATARKGGILRIQLDDMEVRRLESTAAVLLKVYCSDVKALRIVVLSNPDCSGSRMGSTKSVHVSLSSADFYDALKPGNQVSFHGQNGSVAFMIDTIAKSDFQGRGCLTDSQDIHLN
ncbi:MAG: hypothetical protein V1827_04820 [Candidatus Micrarchaeota archaeon]